jgi:hypothetical protein
MRDTFLNRQQRSLADRPSGLVDLPRNDVTSPPAGDRRRRRRFAVGVGVAVIGVAAAAVGRSIAGSPRRSITFSGYFGEYGPSATMDGAANGWPIGPSKVSGHGRFASYPAPAPPCGSEPGTSATGATDYTASNGDVLHVSYSGTLCKSGEDSVGLAVYEFTGTFTIEGGTGRFVGARGNGRATSRYEFQSGDPATGTYSGADTGTITFSGSARH